MLTRHGLALVLTTETSGPLVAYLQKNAIPFETTKITENKKVSKNELWGKVEALQPTIGVLASFGAIIPQRIIDLFPNGIWNIHPSLLPKYKGPSPIQYTLLSEDTKTGVTIITLDNQVDHGPILAQEEVDLTGNETTEQLKNDLFTLGSTLIENQLIRLENNEKIESTPQDHSKESWTEKIIKKSGRIDLESLPSSDQLDRMIRAYFPWPTVMFEWEINGKTKLVKLLPGKQVQIEGKNAMSYKDFINGYGEQGKALLEKLRVGI
jgi:methionyl-tRNA formyltransferase